MNLWMIQPESTPPTALPTTAGKRCAPATALDAFAVIWKYKGTENISYNRSSLAHIINRKSLEYRDTGGTRL